MRRSGASIRRDEEPRDVGRWAPMTALSCSLALMASLGFAQSQPDETLPGFKTGNVFEVHGIDNVNLFSGDPGVVIPLGPEYTLGPNYRWQLKAHYSPKFWGMSICNLNSQYKYAWIRGDPTIGVGWSLLLGYFSAYGGPEQHDAYFSPDGGQHQVDGYPVTVDGTHLRVSTSASTVEYPDGSVATLGHQFKPPQPVFDSSSDFSYVWGAGPNRSGVSQIQDSFRNTVLTVKYDTNYPDEITSIVLTPNCSAPHLG